jgi:hypothetical protein
MKAIRQQKLRQYTAAFLAGCFALTMGEARAILRRAGFDRTKAAEMARLLRYPRTSSWSS